MAAVASQVTARWTHPGEREFEDAHSWIRLTLVMTPQSPPAHTCSALTLFTLKLLDEVGVAYDRMVPNELDARVSSLTHIAKVTAVCGICERPCSLT